jgi:ABC-2 type transport system permease protein
MIPLLQSELFRLRKRPQSMILLLITILVTGAIYAAFFIASQVMSDEAEAADVARDLALPNVFEIGMQVSGLFVSIMLIVMASGLIGNEYSWNTVRPLIARSRTRSGLLTAKWITVALYTVLLFLVALISSAVFSAITSSMAGEFVGLSAGLLGDWGVAFARVLMANLPYIAIAFSLALLTRSNAVGISVGIALGLLEPALWGLLGLLSDRFDTIRQVGIEFHSTRLLSMNNALEDASVREAWISAGVMALYTVFFVVLSYIVFTRRDVTSG